MITSTWTHLFFHWPDGGVWSNLAASLIWAPLAVGGGWLLKRKLDRIHRHVYDLHAKHDALAARLARTTVVHRCPECGARRGVRHAETCSRRRRRP